MTWPAAGLFWLDASVEDEKATVPNVERAVIEQQEPIVNLVEVKAEEFLPQVAAPTPEQRVVDDAAAALGGAERLLAVRTVVIEGEGTQYNLGQDVNPDASGQTFTVTGYRRAIDVAGRSALDAVNNRSYECSVPFTCTVFEHHQDGKFARFEVEPVPDVP